MDVLLYEKARGCYLLSEGKKWTTGKKHVKVVPNTELNEYLKLANKNEFASLKALHSDLSYIEWYEGMTTVKEVKNEAPETGIFNFFASMFETGLQPYAFSTDEFIPLSAHTKRIMEDVDNFLNSGDRYASSNILHKRGLLLYGPPGNGKTMLLEQIAKQYADEALVIFVKDVPLETISSLRAALEGRQVILLAEEFNAHGTGEKLLSLLDGEDSWNHCLTIATTNHPEHIPLKFIDRPGRFDAIFELGLPDATTRRLYLESKLPKPLVNESLVKNTEGLSLGYLRELVIASKIYDKPIMNIIEGFRQRKEAIAKFQKA